MTHGEFIRHLSISNKKLAPIAFFQRDPFASKDGTCANEAGRSCLGLVSSSSAHRGCSPPYIITTNFSRSDTARRIGGTDQSMRSALTVLCEINRGPHERSPNVALFVASGGVVIRLRVSARGFWTGRYPFDPASKDILPD